LPSMTARSSFHWESVIGYVCEEGTKSAPSVL
jgi:hypothetical protein